MGSLRWPLTSEPPSRAGTALPVSGPPSFNSLTDLSIEQFNPAETIFGRWLPNLTTNLIKNFY